MRIGLVVLYLEGSFSWNSLKTDSLAVEKSAFGEKDTFFDSKIGFWGKTKTQYKIVKGFQE